MRILIENSEYWLRNNGDLAMLQVTVDRLRARWPHARIGVLTDSPALLAAYFPAAEGITVFDADPWSRPQLISKIARVLGPRVVGPVALAHLRGRVWLPQKARGARRRLLRNLFPQRPVPEELASPRPHVGSMRAAAEADMVVALGGGYLTDADRAQTLRVLNLVEHAGAHDVPVALLGQGVGPLTDDDLTRRCSQVLPGVSMIAVRERRRGPALLDRFGVPPERVRVTGDDAIELAHTIARADLGTGVGICLRIAGYSPVADAAARVVGQVVREAAEHNGSPLVPLIIAEYRNQDRRSTLPLVRGARSVVPPLPRFVAPREVARRVGDCRVLVTGAYHLAVFALSQGIPVVAITSTEYYDDKFLGLADMFGLGLTVVRLDDPELETKLRAAVNAAWEAAPNVREPLRDSARAQIATSRAAFDRVHSLLLDAVSERA
ncbi:polysaccharide pyruvyl transferase family protein [Williamsia sp. CHRR-6]|nr:polysaccharide pyruvyl transferase family protein [Williamsia sp. CHRR-6]